MLTRCSLFTYSIYVNSISAPKCKLMKCLTRARTLQTRMHLRRKYFRCAFTGFRESSLLSGNANIDDCLLVTFSIGKMQILKAFVWRRRFDDEVAAVCCNYNPFVCMCVSSMYWNVRYGNMLCNIHKLLAVIWTKQWLLCCSIVVPLWR